MRFLQRVAGASTPAYRTVWNRGGAAQGGEPGEQGQRVHFHRKRAASERTLQNDAHEAVWPQLHVLLRDGRAEDLW